MFEVSQRPDDIFLFQCIYILDISNENGIFDAHQTTTPIEQNHNLTRASYAVHILSQFIYAFT